MQSKRWYVSRILLGLVFALLVWMIARMADSGRPPMLDFVQYWAACRLNLDGHNPYSPGELLALEREVEPATASAVMMWNPPWALTIMSPIAILPYPVARAVWLLVSLSVLLLSPLWAWAVYSGATKPRLAPSLLLAMFAPAWEALSLGQISPLMLLGICGFLFFSHQQRWWLAGVLASLATVKPQVLFLFWSALVLWSIKERRWSVILGLGTSVVFLYVLAALPNQQVMLQYVNALAQHPPTQWGPPTLGTLLRAVFGVHHFWLIFVPPLIGLGWLAIYWQQHKDEWTWERDLPLLSLVSLLTVPYAWVQDFVVGFVAIVQVMPQLLAAENRRRVNRLIGTYLVLTAVSLAQFFFFNDVLAYIWMPMAFLLLYLTARAEPSKGGPSPGVPRAVL